MHEDAVHPQNEVGFFLRQAVKWETSHFVVWPVAAKLVGYSMGLGRRMTLAMKIVILGALLIAVLLALRSWARNKPTAPRSRHDPVAPSDIALALKGAARADSRSPDMPKGWAAETPGDDPADLVKLPKYHVRTVPADLALRYVDAGGLPSSRRIRIVAFNKRPWEADWMILAWCYERRAPRHFRTSRMVEVADLSTGEVRNDPESALSDWGMIWDEQAASEAKRSEAHQLRSQERQQQRQAARQAAAPSRPIPMTKQVAVHEAAVNVLLCVARADGRRTAAETEIILGYLADRLGSAFDVDRVSKILKKAVPDPDRIDADIAELQARGELSQIAALARRLMEADGKVDAAEQVLIDRLAAQPAASTG